MDYCLLWPIINTMNEIKCPNCGKTFKIDEASFSAILKQVRDSEFEKELHERIDSEVRAVESKTRLELQSENSRKEAEIAELRRQGRTAEAEARLAEFRRQYPHESLDEAEPPR